MNEPDGQIRTPRSTGVRRSIRSGLHVVVIMLWLLLLMSMFTGCATSNLYAADGVQLDVPHVVLDTGHTRSVNAIVQDSRTNYVFSASDDGTVRIWNPQTGSLQQTLRISHLPVVALAVNPTSTELAAVVSDGGVYFELTAWDWATGKKLFSRSLTEVPLLLKFSPKGSFLLYARTRWNSLVFLDSKDGHDLNYLPNGFGIVRFAIISASERTVMTYSPSSGELAYWDLESGTRKATISTITNLEHVTKISDIYVSGVVGDTLTLVNIVDGSVVSQAQLGQVQMLRSDQTTDQIAALYTSTTDGNTQTQIALYSVRNGSLSRDFFAADSAPADISAMILLNRSVLYGERTGALSTLSAYSTEPADFSKNIVIPVTDLAFSDDRFFAVTDQGLVSIKSDFFDTNRPDLPGVTRIAEVGASNPFDTRSGLLSLPNGPLYIWRGGDQPGELKRIDPTTLQVTDTAGDFSAPLLSAQPAGAQILTLERNGHVQLLNPSTYDREFSYNSSGTLCTVYADRDGIVVGKNNTNILDSALVRVAPVTGETVRLDTPEFLVFGLAFDQRHHALYSLGLQHKNGTDVTVLEEHTGADFSRTRTLATYTGEDLQATLTYDERSNKIFSTLGFDRVQVWDGSRLTQLAPSGHIPREVVSWNGRVYSVNRDGSVSVWDIETRKHLFDFFVLPDGSWVILTPNGSFLPSSLGNPEQYLRVVDPRLSTERGTDTSSLPSLDLFRLKINGTESTVNQPGAFDQTGTSGQ